MQEKPWNTKLWALGLGCCYIAILWCKKGRTPWCPIIKLLKNQLDQDEAIGRQGVRIESVCCLELTLSIGTHEHVRLFLPVSNLLHAPRLLNRESCWMEERIRWYFQAKIGEIPPILPPVCSSEHCYSSPGSWLFLLLQVLRSTFSP